LAYLGGNKDEDENKDKSYQQITNSWLEKQI